jgi:hypothetical protein
MKTQLQKIKMAVLGLMLSIGVKAQTTADLQNLTLAADTFWNGATATPSVSTSGSFTSGNAIFPNAYNGNYGGYWESGWAYSNKKDSVTVGYTNQYSARPAVGYNNSSIYAVAQGGAVLKFNAAAIGKQMLGFYVTNGTYDYLSMKNGDAFAKKFGDTTGTHCGCPQGSYPDWFKLTVKKYVGGMLNVDSVEFYLADYRFANNTQDYILKTWQYVDLTSLGNVDSLLFTLSSSDVGVYGMNTPNYFCLDNFITSDGFTTVIAEVKNIESSIFLYPNPSNDVLNISDEKFKSMEILNASGQIVYSSESTMSNISFLSEGIYAIRIYETDNTAVIRKFVKIK